jgi:hypothetical protein
MNKVWATVLGCASVLAVASLVTPTTTQADPPASHKGAHKHTHFNGHDLLGGKIKQDGKHAIGKLGSRSVEAEVKGGKVVGMSAGDLPVKHVTSHTKMAASEGAVIRASWNQLFQPAQYDTVYYGYCFDDGINYTCYWYPESDVAYQDSSWVPYDPTY